MKKFTLVELLVVIAIIATLAAMLLPALNKARDKSRTISCVSNQKQIGLALGMYNNDFDGFFPKGFSGGIFWSQTVFDCGYLPQSVFACPSVLGERPGVDKFGADTAKMLRAGTVSGWRWMCVSPGLNAGEMGGYEDTDDSPYLKAGNIKQPSFFIVAAETSGPVARVYNTFEPSRTMAFPHHANGQQLNVIHGDGHVKTYTIVGKPNWYDFCSFAYSEEGPLKGRQYDNNPWTRDGAARSTTNR